MMPLIFTTLYSAVVHWNFSCRHNDFKPSFTLESSRSFLLAWAAGGTLRQPARYWHSTGYLETTSAIIMTSFMSVITANTEWKFITEERAHLLHFCLKNTMANVSYRPREISTIVTDNHNPILSFRMIKKRGRRKSY